RLNGSPLRIKWTHIDWACVPGEDERFREAYTASLRQDQVSSEYLLSQALYYQNQLTSYILPFIALILQGGPYLLPEIALIFQGDARSTIPDIDVLVAWWSDYVLE